MADENQETEGRGGETKAATSPPPPPPVTVPPTVEEYQRLRGLEGQLADLRTAQAAALEAKQAEVIQALADKGKVQEALEAQRPAARQHDLEPALDRRRRRGVAGMSTVALHLGDCLDVLRTLDAGSVDAVVTDPPYSSGGFTRGDRTAPTASKYVQSGTATRRPDFAGDTRDQRSWLYWCALWLGECARIVKPGGYVLMFTDWRQLPQATDALQCGGLVWRGLIAWDKTEASRAPHKGYFRHQCEYVAWGTTGALKAADWGGPWPGCFRVPVRQADKHHQTGKPVELMEKLVACVPPGGTVLDPYMGSGSTGVACVRAGRNFVGVEVDPGYHAVARARIDAELAARAA